MKTAVEWLWENLDVDIRLFTHCKDTFEQAKELEKQQIEDAFCDGVDDEYEHHINDKIRKNSEEYYNEKFNK